MYLSIQSIHTSKEDKGPVSMRKASDTVSQIKHAYKVLKARSECEKPLPDCPESANR